MRPKPHMTERQIEVTWYLIPPNTLSATDHQPEVLCPREINILALKATHDYLEFWVTRNWTRPPGTHQGPSSLVCTLEPQSHSIKCCLPNSPCVPGILDVQGCNSLVLILHQQLVYSPPSSSTTTKNAHLLGNCLRCLETELRTSSNTFSHPVLWAYT